MTDEPPLTYRSERQAIDDFRRQWEVIIDPVPRWNAAFREMRDHTLNLKAEGVWRSGRRTLLAELGIATDEVLMCRGLAWLLTPDGWHGLGTRFLGRFLSDAGVPAPQGQVAVVEREVSRTNTRADIVIRLPNRTVVIEAKINAPEMPNQCDRLAADWPEELVTLVLLTRSGHQPVSARTSGHRWRVASWAGLVRLIDGSLRDVEMTHGPHHAHPGVRELADTFRHTLA